MSKCNECEECIWDREHRDYSEHEIWLVLNSINATKYQIAETNPILFCIICRAEEALHVLLKKQGEA